MKKLEKKLISNLIDVVCDLNSNKSLKDSILGREYLFNQINNDFYIHTRYRDGVVGTILKININGNGLDAILVKGINRKIGKYLKTFSQENKVSLNLNIY